jgi:molybdate transport system ATP-binding protein
MIEIKNIDTIKSGLQLFNSFSWTIYPDQNWVISGLNGSGKTHLLEALAGLLHFRKGKIEYDFIQGESWDQQYSQKRRFITYIPTHALQNFVSGSSDMYYQQRYYDIGDERTPTVKSLLGDGVENIHRLNLPASLSVTHLLNVEVTRLSNGQLKKLLLVKSLLRGIPKLLLLDYPFEGLDHESRENLCQFIDFIALQHGVQIILVDQHHHVPNCINRKLTMEKFEIKNSETFLAAKHETGLRNTSPPEFPSGNRQEVVRMENLELRYGDHVVIKNFNWKVHQGERWALVGRNGSGKTTLFSLIFADHPQAYAQRVYLFGKRRGSGESIWDIKRRITYLGPEQINYIHPDGIGLITRDYITSMNRGATGASLENLVDYFRADEFMNKPVRFLSSGQLQLTMIIISFLSDKELLLLDEPFQFLDGAQRDRLTNYLLTHLKPETTLILITHYEHDIRQWTNLRMEI